MRFCANSVSISDENKAIMNKTPSKYRCGFVAIIGRSNVGKSTLMNYIIGYKVAIVANKPQTTRNRIQTVYTEDRGQVIFQDTPGLHDAGNELSKKMVSAAKKTMNEADVVLWIVEPNANIGRQDLQIAELIKTVNSPIILAINKCDRLKGNEVLPVIDEYSKLYSFDEIVPVSAITGDNVPKLIDVLFKYLPYSDKLYDDDTLTDQPIRQIASELIREKALNLLDDEIPHGVAVYIEKMKSRTEKDITDIEAVIVCERESHKGIIIGKKGAMIKKIGSLARTDIEDLMQTHINLQLFVKCRKDWRNNDSHIKNFEIFNDL